MTPETPNRAEELRRAEQQRVQELKEDREREERRQKYREDKEWMDIVKQVNQTLEARKLKPEQLRFQDFVEHRAVQDKLQELRDACAKEKKRFSDIVDAQGHQYVDLVMEGGGTLGIALLGYIYALESAGIRFLSIGGTSAGSITALLLAAVNKDKSEQRTEALFKMLSELNLSTVLDSKLPTTWFIWAIQQRVPLLDEKASLGARLRVRLKSLSIGFLRVLSGVLSSPGLLHTLGLNPGKRLEERISGILKAQGVGDTGALNKRVGKLPEGGLFLRTTAGEELMRLDIPEGKEPRLALIACEVSTGTKVSFPKMAPLFWPSPDRVDPTLFVRASMSVPFFFRPLHLTDVPTRSKAAEWEKLLDFAVDATRDASCTLVDGGIMSNFPISEFHSIAPPHTPTFGVKLGLETGRLERIRPRGIRAQPLGQLGLSLLKAARETLDEDFLNNNPDYKKLIAYINTGNHNWLDFKLSAADQVDLFLRGVAAGAVFLKHFNWDEYKRVREELYNAQRVGLS